MAEGVSAVEDPFGRYNLSGQIWSTYIHISFEKKTWERNLERPNHYQQRPTLLAVVKSSLAHQMDEI